MLVLEEFKQQLCGQFLGIVREFQFWVRGWIFGCEIFLVWDFRCVGIFVLKSRFFFVNLQVLFFFYRCYICVSLLIFFLYSFFVRCFFRVFCFLFIYKEDEDKVGQREGRFVVDYVDEEAEERVEQQRSLEQLVYERLGSSGGYYGRFREGVCFVVFFLEGILGIKRGFYYIRYRFYVGFFLVQRFLGLQWFSRVGGLRYFIEVFYRFLMCFYDIDFGCFFFTVIYGEVGSLQFCY